MNVDDAARFRARILELEDLNGKLRARIENLEDAARLSLKKETLEDLESLAEFEEDMGHENGGGSGLIMLLQFYKRVKKAAAQ
jgi:hypothetical protein